MRLPFLYGNVFVSAPERVFNNLAKTVGDGYHSVVRQLLISPIQ